MLINPLSLSHPSDCNFIQSSFQCIPRFSDRTEGRERINHWIPKKGSRGEKVGRKSWSWKVLFMVHVRTFESQSCFSVSSSEPTFNEEEKKNSLNPLKRGPGKKVLTFERKEWREWYMYIRSSFCRFSFKNLFATFFQGKMSFQYFFFPPSVSFCPQPSFRYRHFYF